MDQSRIKDFFTPLDSSTYNQQVHRERHEHAASSAERQATELLRSMRRNAKRRVGRPRKTVVQNITINSGDNSVNVICIDVDNDEPASRVSSSSSSTTSPRTSPLLSPSPPAASSASSAPCSPTVPEKRRRTNWTGDHSAFRIIVDTVQRLRSYQAAVDALQHNELTAKTFEQLSESTVRSWFEPRSFVLKKNIEDRWERGGGHQCIGRPALMDQHQHLEQWVVMRVNNLRRAGGVVDSSIVHAYFRGILRVRAPELLKQYQISRRWCRNWMQTQLAWTYRKGTTAGQKLPADWEAKVEALANRVAGTAAQHDITHGCLIINFDQTAVQLMQTNKYTYHGSGESRVPITGSDDKRQITVVVGSTLAGQMLPLQLIFKGQDTNKKQHKAVPTLPDHVKRRVTNAKFHLTQTHNHWSTLDSMKDYITLVIKRWVNERAAELTITNPHCILILDCWKVHTGEAFRSWMARQFPRYHLCYVPAGCTSKAQPADVMLQRPFKADIVRSFTWWMSDQISTLVNVKEDPDKLRVDTSLATLKPLLVEWAWKSWCRLTDKPKMVGQGWEKAGLGDVLKEGARQREAMKFCMNEKAQTLEEEAEDDPDTESEVDCGEEEEDAVE